MSTPSRDAAGRRSPVVGLLLAALYDPVWSSAIGTHADFALALVTFGLLMFWRLAPWLVLGITATGATGLAALT